MVVFGAGLSQGTIRVLDGVVVAWTLAWVVLAVVLAREVRQLEELGDGAVSAGRALEQTANALGRLRDVPFVGGDIEAFERRVRAAGREAVVGGRRGQEEVRTVSVLIGIVVAIGPTLPPLALYALVRVAWARERRAVRSALLRGDPTVDVYLADRALARAPFAQPYGLGAEPSRDPPAGRTPALADAELARLGLTRTRR